MKTLAAIKRSMQAGHEYDVTNHYITRPDHASYGTQRRTLVKVNGSALWLTNQAHPEGARVEWPKAGQAEMDDDGTVRLYGGGTGQKPDELFLTLVPVRQPAEPIQRTCDDCGAQPGTECTWSCSSRWT
jgi:hypothetical protein